MIVLEAIRTTQLKYDPVGMCVDNGGLLIICGPRANVLYKYSSHGQEVSHVQLSPRVKPGFIVSDNSMYMISDYTNKQIVWVKMDSLLTTVVHTAGQGSSVLHLGKGKVFKPCYPLGLTQDRYGRIMVADNVGHQVIVFDQHGKCTGQLLGKQDGIYKPGSILLDQHNDKLYVACMDNKSIYVMIYDYFPR